MIVINDICKHNNSCNHCYIKCKNCCYYYVYCYYVYNYYVYSYCCIQCRMHNRQLHALLNIHTDIDADIDADID